MFVLTKPQRKAVHTLFVRHANGFANYRAFRKALVRPMLFGGGAIQVEPWCGMFIGIEPDGYTHS